MVKRRVPATTYTITMPIDPAPPAPTCTQRLRALSKAAIHYVNTLTTGLYSDVDREQAMKRYEAAKNAITVADLKDE